MSRAAHTTIRAALAGCVLLALLLVTSPQTAFASSTGEAASIRPDAGISIVNGRSTSIREWPWQVALTTSRKASKFKFTSRRFFCGGAILAPRLVLTAGHCVAGMNRRQIRQTEVVAGRTRLNSSQGEVAKVAQSYMPRRPNGKRRYREVDGTSDWDVALLRLRSPLSSPPIKLAGPDERAAWAPGQVVWSTGWGVTGPFANRVPARLRVARQVMMSDGLCRRSEGNVYRKVTMNCIGGPGGNASTCFGDSGGPLAARTSDGFRLVGLTSFGDDFCRGISPSVDTRVAGDQIRSWIAKTATRLTGADVVGSGATAPPRPEWCKVPNVFGLKPAQARWRLEAANCRLGKVRLERWAFGRRGRVTGASRLPGWLAPVNYRLDVWIKR